MRRMWVVLLVLGGLTVGAARAEASFLVYMCGGNLCRINADGSGATQLTHDGHAGTAHEYAGPSLSRDGSKLSFVDDEQIFVGDAVGAHRIGPFPGSHSAAVTVMRPDGGKLAELEFGVLTNGSELCTYDLSGSGRDCLYDSGAAGWAPDGELLIETPSPHGNQTICQDSPTTPAACTHVVAADSTSDLYDPAVSPDGRTLAVTATGRIGTAVTGHIALYSYPSGRLERALTSGSSDSEPTWSPDSSQIAFTHGSSIEEVALSGGSGPQRLASGTSPTWGGPSTRLSLAVSSHQTPVHSRKIAATVGCASECYSGAYAEVTIGSARPFEVDSQVVHLTRAGRKSVPLSFSRGQLRSLASALRGHKRIVATVYGQLTNARGTADLLETRGQRLTIRS
jgi:hypothetical protein